MWWIGHTVGRHLHLWVKIVHIMDATLNRWKIWKNYDMFLDMERVTERVLNKNSWLRGRNGQNSRLSLLCAYIFNWFICSDNVRDMIVSRLFSYSSEKKVSVLSSALRKSGYHFALSENCLKNPIDQPVPTKIPPPSSMYGNPHLMRANLSVDPQF